MGKPVEDTLPIISPVQPLESTTQGVMIGLLRDKLNETIEIVNVLREETIKLKNKNS